MMKKYLLKALLFVFPCFMMLFYGCTVPEEVLRFEPEAQGNVKIGVIVPLSGPDASQGRKMLNGARFAADDLNSRRGHFGKRVQLLVADTRSTGDGAAEAFRKVVREGAIGIVGGYSTLEAQSITGLARTLRVPLVIPMATGNDDVIMSNNFVFRNVFTDRQQAEMIAGFMKYYRRVNRMVAAVSSDPRNVYSRNVVRDVTDAFRELGGEVVTVCEVSVKNRRQVMKEAVSLAPDAIVLPFGAAEAAACYKILREFGYAGLICGPDTWDDPAFFKALRGLKSPGNNFYTAFFSNEARHTEFAAFRDKFRKKLFYYPDSCEIQTFDALNMLLIGFGNNGTDLKRFNRNWQSMKKHAGAAAIYTMKPGSRIDRTIYINRIGNPPLAGRDFVPRNITSLQYSRLEDYKVDE